MSGELNYTDYNFENLVNQLINRLKARDTWKDTYRSGTGQMLIELYAYVANLVLYYAERRAEEGYIETARLRSSVLRLVRLINYIPKRKVSSTGILTFSLSSALTKKVFIPKYTECETSDSTKFLVSEDVVIMPGETSVDAEAIQGELVEVEYTSTGESNQSYTVNDTSIENTSLLIYVNGIMWTEVTSFYQSTNVSEDYRITHEIDDTITIHFGDNVNGKIPVADQLIRFVYVQSSGLDGNIYQTDKITSVNSTIYDEDGDAVTVTVTNDDVFIGGDDEEDIEEIRTEAPKVFATGDRAVTKADFISTLENYAGITTANVWGENEESPPNYDEFNKVNISILLQNWQDPSTAFKTDLSEYLYDKSVMTVKYEYIDAVVINVVVVISSLKVIKGNTLSMINSNVTTAIENEFELGTTTKLGISKRLSDLISVVDNLTGVSYHHLYLQIRKQLSDTYNSINDYGALLEATPILPESVTVYLGSSIVAVDDGSGNLIDSVSGYTITNGTVNYTTGEIVLDISPTPTEIMFVRYQQDEDGDVVITNRQICKLYSTDIQSISYDE